MNIAWAFVALILFFLIVINGLYLATMKDVPVKTPKKAFAIATMFLGLITTLFAIFEASQQASGSVASQYGYYGR